MRCSFNNENKKRLLLFLLKKTRACEMHQQARDGDDEDFRVNYFNGATLGSSLN